MGHWVYQHDKRAFAPVGIRGMPSPSSLGISGCLNGSGDNSWGDQLLLGWVPGAGTPVQPVGSGACGKALPVSCPVLLPRPRAGGMWSISRAGRTMGFSRLVQGCTDKGWTENGLNWAGSPSALQKQLGMGVFPVPPD